MMMTAKEYAKMYGLKIGVISSAHSAGKSNYNIELVAPNGERIYIDRFVFEDSHRNKIFDHDEAMRSVLDYIMQCADDAEYADENIHPDDWTDWNKKSLKVVQDFQAMVGVVGYEEFLFACRTEGNQDALQQL